jgi:hypothetical protein
MGFSEAMLVGVQYTADQYLKTFLLEGERRALGWDDGTYICFAVQP